MSEASSILDQIVYDKRRELAAKAREVPLSDIKNKLSSAPPARSLKDAISHKKMSLIAEIKRASPSRGVLRSDLDPVQTAQKYHDNLWFNFLFV